MIRLVKKSLGFVVLRPWLNLANNMIMIQTCWCNCWIVSRFDLSRVSHSFDMSSFSLRSCCTVSLKKMVWWKIMKKIILNLGPSLRQNSLEHRYKAYWIWFLISYFPIPAKGRSKACADLKVRHVNTEESVLYKKKNVFWTPLFCCILKSTKKRYLKS